MPWLVCECLIKEISFLSNGDTGGITDPSLGTDPGEGIADAGKVRCDVAGVIISSSL